MPSLEPVARRTGELPDQPPDDDPPDEDPPDESPPPPQPAPPPSRQGTLVRITAGELQGMLHVALGGTQLVLDTSHTSVPITSAPFYHCSYPNQVAHYDELARCLQLQNPERSECIDEVNADYPNVEVCNWTTGPAHSYIKFSGLVKASGAADVPFNDIVPMYRDSWGPGGVLIGLNYVRTLVDLQTTTAGIIPLHGQKPWLMATAWIAMKLQSNQPTLSCEHDHIPCPDLELTNMKLEVHLHSIAPNPANDAQLGFHSVVPYFSFTRNMNNIPDWMITPFFDVDQLIKNRVNANVERALTLSSSREALNKALTQLVVQQANHKNGSRGIERFYNAWYESPFTLVVDYKPCPPAGECPTTM